MTLNLYHFVLNSNMHFMVYFIFLLYNFLIGIRTQKILFYAICHIFWLKVYLLVMSQKSLLVIVHLVQKD